MSEPDVSADAPDSLLQTTGTDHVTLVGSNPEETVAFYRDVLGMRLVLRQPNLDRPDVTHLFFDAGDGRLVTFFVEEGRESADEQRPETGAVHHLAFRIGHERLPEIRENLTENDHGFSEYDRGAFHALYTEDHNGLTIELVVDKYDIPDDRRAEVLALAQQKRVADSASYAEGEHVEAALADLGIDAQRRDLPAVAAGRGME